MNATSKLFIAAMVGAFSAVGAADEPAKHSHKPRATSTEETPFGRQGDPSKVSRTIDVDMSDKLRFAPSDVSVKRGETIRFRVKNSGQTMHEMVLGTKQALEKHAEAMRQHPGMKHDTPYIAHVAPGKTGTIVWQFSKAGEFHYACLVPGHFEAGMTGRVRVSEKPSVRQDLKALSAEEIDDYRAGAGMGYAKAAELNHFPGPVHVLELAGPLGLTAEQRTATERLMQAHKAAARALGAKLVAAEQALEHLFRSGHVEQGELARAVAAAARLQGEYRLSHLETHRRMRALLNDEQVTRYDALRGHHRKH